MKYIPYPDEQGRAGEDAVLHHVFHELEGCDSLLDAGCGVGKYLLRLQSWRKFCKGICAVDAHAASLKEVISDTKVCGKLPEILRDGGLSRYDAVMCLDVIEHLTKPEAFETLDLFERWYAHKKVIIFTPSGFQHQPPDSYNPWMEHLSGWEASEFEARGYEVSVWKDFDYGRGNIGNALWAVKMLP